VRGGRDGAKGSGLGLAIVRSVAQSHGGTVDLGVPEDGVGTRFVIRIPMIRDAAEVVADPAQNGATQTSTTTGRTIGRRRSRS
jgi:nitrogen-specific signal transduction histidine kinase